MTHSSPESVQTELLEQRLSGMTKLLEMTCRLAAEQDLERVLRMVTTEACRALNCDRASLFLYDETREELYTRVVTELEIAEIRVPIDFGITGWVARHRELTNIPDPPLDPRWSPRFDRETGYRTESILTAPLISIHNGRLVGVLQLLNKAGGSFDVFDEQLIQAFGAHAAVALERAQLVEELKQKQLMEASINLARDIQSSFQPQQLPDLPGYEVAAWWQPAEGVGGDYYDLLPLPDGRVLLTVADVSGHGVGPSLIMASARAMLHILTHTMTEPEKILTLLSESIAPDLQDGRFITFFLGALDWKRHRFDFANAGHAPAMHFAAKTGTFHPMHNTGFPLGVDPDFPFDAGPVVSLATGDVILLATDGSFEQCNAAHEMFGQERLREIIAREHNGSAKDILDVLRTEIRSFFDGDHPADDITLLVIKRL